MGKSELDSAQIYIDSLEHTTKRNHNEAGLIRAAYYRGVSARLRGDYTSALKYINRYIEYYQQKGDSSKVSNGLYQIGVIQNNLGNYEKSLTAYYRSLIISEKDNDQYGAAINLNTIGVLLRETKKYRDAETAHNRALRIFDSLDKKSDKTDVLVNLGNLYTATGDFQKARDCYLQALQIDKQIGKENGVAVSLANIAFLFDKAGNYDSALVYHLAALKIREHLPRKEDLGRSLIGVGLGYLRINNYPQARKYLTGALKLVEQTRSKPMMQDVFENLAELNSKEGNYAEAFRYYKLYAEIKDSIFGATNAKQLAELQTKYETSEKDRRISLLANEKLVQQKNTERQVFLKNILVVGLFVVSAFTILLFFFFRQRIRSQKMIAEKNVEINEISFKRQMVDLEMKALRAQINPHFFFNCMNSINKLILQGDTETASLYLARFSKLVRLILENTELSSVSLKNELTLLESYIQMEALRFNGRISYEITVDQSIQPENTYLPSMVLQPIVENAIWHGLMHKAGEDKGLISIVVSEKKNQLLCTIEDNGIGRQKAAQLREHSLMNRKSMGMKITEERLKMLNAQGQESIKVIDLTDALQQSTGTRVEVNIPLS